MTIMEEINEVFPLHIPRPNFVCKFHKYNKSCIKMATGEIFSPRIKHIALKYHHFRNHANSGQAEIQCRPKNGHLADILTKYLSKEDLFTHHYMLCGWGYAPNKSISN